MENTDVDARMYVHLVDLEESNGVLRSCGCGETGS